MASEQRDWTDLPPELIHLISMMLPDLRYFIRCRVVCKRWFSSIVLSDPPPQQLPWLVECEKVHDPPHYVMLLRKELRFHSIVDDETGAMPIHESHRRGEENAFIRTEHTYLLFRDRIAGDISLINPLTNKVISFPQMHPCFGIIWPVVWGEDPSPNSNWHLLNHTGKNIFYLATDHPDKMDFQYVVYDNPSRRTCYWMGKIFVTERDYTALVFDVASRKMLHSIPPPKDCIIPDLLNTNYIVESCGVILLVSWHFPYGRYVDLKASSFHVYKLSFEAENEQPCWVKVRDIGNQIVFLDSYSGFSAGAPAGLKGNCLYILFKNTYRTPFHYYTGNELWRYDIGTGTAELVPCPFKRCMWFVPSLH